jgi:hypothetical protein
VIDHFVRSQEQLTAITGELIEAEHRYPLRLIVKPSRDSRSKKQNRLLWQWLNDLESQGDQSAQGYRAEIKLYYGVPIMRAGCEYFRAEYDRAIKPLGTEQKLILMAEPWDIPVTSLMDVKQMKLLLDRVWYEYSFQGYRLTDPFLLGLESYGGCIAV